MQYPSTSFTRLFSAFFAFLVLTAGTAANSWSQARPRQDSVGLSLVGSSAGTSRDTRVSANNYKASLTGLLHWAHFPVRVAFVNNVRSGKQELNPLALRGFDQWVNATQGAVRYEVISNPSKADIVVTFEVVPYRPLNGERLGTTGFRYNRERLQLSRADMRLNVWEDMTADDLARFVNTVAHEFGHALGINGHSLDPDDLMYYSSSRSQGVSLRDLNTLRLAYDGFSHGEEKQARRAIIGKPGKSS